MPLAILATSPSGAAESAEKGSMIGVAPVIFEPVEAVADAADRFQVGLGQAAVALEDDHHRHLFAAACWLLLEDVEGAGRFGVLGQEAGSGRRR